MFSTIYGRAMKVLMQKPLKLWGISLLSTLLIPVLGGLCGFAVPGLAIAISLLMTTSMTMVYLSGYRGEEVHTTQIFSCFKDWTTIKRVVLGMAWMMLWIFIWSLVPVVGPILAIIRTYEYRLTPYILITEPDVAITDVLKESSKRTTGYKLQMWLADFLVDLAFAVAVIILFLLAMIPYVGVLFLLVLFLLMVCYAALRPLFGGLVQAAFYEEITNPTVPETPVQPQYQQPPYQQPYYYQPPYQAPQYEQPQTQTPQYEQPQTQAPQYEQPPYQAPQYEQPQTQAPQYEQPQYQAPQYEQPQYQAPQYQAPQQEAPQYQQPAAPAVKFCPGCGSSVEPGTKFCGKCGTRL